MILKWKSFFRVNELSKSCMKAAKHIEGIGTAAKWWQSLTYLGDVFIIAPFFYTASAVQKFVFLRKSRENNGY